MKKELKEMMIVSSFSEAAFMLDEEKKLGKATSLANFILRQIARICIENDIEQEDLEIIVDEKRFARYEDVLRIVFRNSRVKVTKSNSQKV
jgi:hypothetical protein